MDNLLKCSCRERKIYGVFCFYYYLIHSSFSKLKAYLGGKGKEVGQ